jgi:protein-tyrosine phosphatase
MLRARTGKNLVGNRQRSDDCAAPSSLWFLTMHLTAPSGTFWIPLPGGQMLAGPHPVLAPEGMEERIAQLVDVVGVDHFVDLSSHHDWMPGYRRLLTADEEYTRYEILDRRLPDDSPRLKALVRRLLSDAAEGRIAYMHCQAGLGRTGTVVGVLLREAGLPGADALDELRELRLAARLHEGSPEFEEQRRFVRDWVV